MAEEIKNILSKILTNQDDWKVKLLQNWPKIIGPLSSKVILEKINNDSLVIGVYDSCWLQELYLLSPILLQKINKTLETDTFKRLRFKQVEIKNNQKKVCNKNTNYKNISINSYSQKLSNREERALEIIKDQELSQALKDFLIRCHINK